MSEIRVLFLGTPAFAVPTLETLRRSQRIKVCGVYTQPPRPAGRGYALHPSPIQQVAHTTMPEVPIYTPLTLTDPQEYERMRRWDLDLIVVVAYGLILPPQVLEIPRFGCLNVHASLLPRWRGASPIQHAILQGDQETGITYMKMAESLDTGPMILQKRIPLGETMTGQMLHDQLALLGAEFLESVVEDMVEGRAVYTPQPSEGVTYAEKLSKDQGRLIWTRPAVQLERQVRAFTPWPGSYFLWKGKPVKVLKAEVSAGVSPALPASVLPGTLVAEADHPLTVACQSGGLRLHSVQVPGKTPLSAQDFVNGYGVKPGEKMD